MKLFGEKHLVRHISRAFRNRLHKNEKTYNIIAWTSRHGISQMLIISIFLSIPKHYKTVSSTIREWNATYLTNDGPLNTYNEGWTETLSP